jgi:tryptophan-rich sensory protein
LLDVTIFSLFIENIEIISDSFIATFFNPSKIDPKETMTPIVWTCLTYLLSSISLTVWVARTLHKNGRIFLVDSFLGNEALADSINHLLFVGF